MTDALVQIRRSAGSSTAPRPRTEVDITDCLIVGFNDIEVSQYVNLVRAMGTDSGAYRDLSLALVEHNGKPYRALDLLNDFYYEGREKPPVPLNNTDFLWPTITYLGPFLHKRGFTFDYINLFQLEKEKFKKLLLRGNVRAVAITTTLYVIPEPILEIISFVRSHDSETKIIVGGPFIANNTSTLDEEALQRFFKMVGADFYVDSSEGEQALANILTALKGDQNFASIENIAYRSGDKYVSTKKSIESSSLADETIRYDIFGREAIGQFVSLRTAKSCPFSCSFCGFPARAGKYVYLNVERVEVELNALRDLGSVSTITFLDDTFNVPKERFKQLLRMMINNRYGFKWNSFYRSDHGDEETIALMAEAGCEGVFLGIESGSDKILTVMNKTSRRKHYMRAIPLMRKYGIMTHANLIVGFPGETYETFQESVALVEEAQPDFYRAQLWYADPITPVWKRKAELGIQGEAFTWSHDTMDSRTASDLVEKMFCCVENSVWLPQYGFELWSVFYLQRFGMSRAQLKTFLRCFNATIRERLVAAPREGSASPALLEALKRSAQFDRPATPDMSAVEVYRGAAYTAAEAFWCEMFRGSAGSRNLPRQGDGAARPDAPERWDVRLFLLDSKACDRIIRGLDHTDLAAATLAACALMLVRVSGRKDATLLASTCSGASLPLRLHPTAPSDFRQLGAETDRLLREADRHGRFAFHFLNNACRMAIYEAQPPAFDIRFVFSAEGDKRSDGSSSPERLAIPGHPELSRDLVLVVEAAARSDGLEIALRFRSSALGPAEVEQLGTLMLAILRDAADAPEKPLATLGLVVDGEQRGPVLNDDAFETFNF